MSEHLGIIPARAGFTRALDKTVLVLPDHPRSRGVYALGMTWRELGHGSSPLARGLLSVGRARLREERIIPARAGFTGRSCGCHTPQSDHPRSRGVYSWVGASWAVAVGSSPLARGLHVITGADVTYARIIPARAGFTRNCRWTPSPSGDHPRSRGVYEELPITYISDWGSSPLARGLPETVPLRTERAGIIPARAGFTCSSGPRTADTPDHPRSRGVYLTL